MLHSGFTEFIRGPITQLFRLESHTGESFTFAHLDSHIQAASDRGNCGNLPGENLLQTQLLCPRILHYAWDLAHNLCCHSGSAGVAAIALINCLGSWVAATITHSSCCQETPLCPSAPPSHVYKHRRAHVRTHKDWSKGKDNQESVHMSFTYLDFAQKKTAYWS